MVWAMSPAPEVLHEAEKYSEGLLVIGASSHAQSAAGRLGPTSEAILRACPSSLLIVKQPMRASNDVARIGASRPVPLEV
jgi:nucleotide-binding universal stress UspA family protein